MNDIKGIIEDCYKSDLVSDNVIKKVIEIIGQVEWQRLHDENNDICTTMGKLIITLDRIEDLEKENAELKDKLNKIERKCKFNFVDLLHDVENESKQEEQLAKAKELLKQWLSLCGFKVEKLAKDTEQFLNSEVEK